LASGNGSDNLKTITQDSESPVPEVTYDQTSNIENNKANFVFDCCNLPRGMQKPVSYFWCLIESIGLWDEFKQNFERDGVTMNNIQLTSSTSTPTKSISGCSKRQRDSIQIDWNEHLVFLHQLQLLNTKSNVLDNLNVQRIKLEDAYNNKHQRYLDWCEKIIKHGNAEDELGLFYRGFLLSLKKS